MKTLLALALLLAGCAGTPARTTRPEPVDEDPDARSLPALRRLGDLAQGPYLFAPAPLERTGETLVRASLIEVGPDAITISVDGGPHRSVSRRSAWPLACLARPLEHDEGALALRLDVGSPVYVLASSRDAARVSIGLFSEHSRVVPRSHLALEGCALEVPSAGERYVAPVGEGDIACLFADQETLDVSAGLAVPTGAPLRVLEEEGDWVRVEIQARGGLLRGWMGTSLVSRASGGAPDWDASALGSAHCVFPGRADPRHAETELAGTTSDSQGIPPAEIERVFRLGQPQIRTCFEARLNERPDLRASLDVVLLVDADGRVASARALRGGDADEPLTRCVLERVRRWRFPAPRIGSIEVRHTFDLRPASAPPAP